MTRLPLVLDAAGLASLCSNRPPDLLRALLKEAKQLDREVVTPTVVCAEVARGRARTRALEAAVARYGRELDDRPILHLLDTDFDLARAVGAILHASGSRSDRMADAHVVAICVPAGGGLVVTSDPDDINELADAVPAVRIRTVSMH